MWSTVRLFCSSAWQLLEFARNIYHRITEKFWNIMRFAYRTWRPHAIISRLLNGGAYSDARYSEMPVSRSSSTVIGGYTPRYFVTSSIPDSYSENPTVRILSVRVALHKEIS